MPSTALRTLTTLTAAVIFLIGTIAPVSTTRAAGLLIAEGGFGGVLEIQNHDVDVVINNGIAVTTVDQTFLNTENRTVEALYTFPVPKGASVANFSMWINGQEMIGEVVEKERAREIYNSYKRQARPLDPGLLEQIDYKTFELRIFPIFANAEQRIRVTYYQELDFDHDRATYVYPLATTTRSGIDSQTTGRFSLRLRAKSEIPIVGLDSPSHGDAFVVASHGRNVKEASLEVNQGDLSRDFVLSYQTKRPRTGLDLITNKPKGEDGFFMLTLTAGDDLDQFDQPTDYVMLMDISGSMAQDQKLWLSSESVAAFIDALGPEDRFDVITFNSQPDMLFEELRLADDENKAQARQHLDTQRARGGTSLAPAMQLAYRYQDKDRPLVVVVLSDGMTEHDERTELLRLIGQRPSNTRVFCIGIGNEVNRPLLEQIADDAGGLASFVSRGDNFERQAQAFRRKLTRPVATDLTINLIGVDVYDFEPTKLPNLYHGSPVRLYGRYRGDGEVKATISGNVMGRPMTRTVSLGRVDENADNPEIERMWAWQRVDSLLKQADRLGSRDSVIDEVIRLGEGYSIVTPYTSFIVLENDSEYQRWNLERRNALRIERDRAAQQRVRDSLDRLRESSLAELGPNGANRIGDKGEINIQVTNSQKTSSDPSTADSTNVDPGGLDWGDDGAGAIDPITGAIVFGLGISGLMRRKRAA